jgi:hypothetical protein
MKQFKTTEVEPRGAASEDGNNHDSKRRSKNSRHVEAAWGFEVWPMRTSEHAKLHGWTTGVGIKQAEQASIALETHLNVIRCIMRSSNLSWIANGADCSNMHMNVNSV